MQMCRMPISSGDPQFGNVFFQDQTRPKEIVWSCSAYEHCCGTECCPGGGMGGGGMYGGGGGYGNNYYGWNGGGTAPFHRPFICSAILPSECSVGL
ncbi:CX domain-containing protein [Aphelenchoides fujianensis]|nr:CX domain-containing protein [Aphelenchoides fujianensis]